MNVLCLGINHRTAPIEIREKLWFSEDEIRTIVPMIRERYASECILTSTCNRTELYYVPHPEVSNGIPLWKFLTEFKKAEPSVRSDHFYTIQSLYAVKHLYSVCAGVDSMVVGDVQILNQIKEAFTLAQELSSTGSLLHRLFTNALHVGKRARTETEIGEGAVSISYAASELASKIFEDLSKRTALLIGAGETGKLTAKHLTGRSLGNLLVTNRTQQRAEELVTQLGGTVIDFDHFLTHLHSADIIIAAVESSNYILSADHLRHAMRLRGNKPLFIIDIGMPRNIDPAANTINNIFLHDIDALSHIVDNNLAHRKAEIHKVESIVLEEVTGFHHWYSSLNVTPTIQQLRDQFEDIRHAEVDRYRNQFDHQQQEHIEILTKRIINKILHTPMVNLKNGSDEGGKETRDKIHLIRHLFGLDKHPTSK